VKPAMRPSCPSCSKTIFNKRYPKCEFCGVVLPEGHALTTEERNRVLKQERAKVHKAWLKAESRFAGGPTSHKVRARAFPFGKVGMAGLAALGISCLGALYGSFAYTVFNSVFSVPRNVTNGLMLWALLAAVPLAIGLLIGYFAKLRKVSGARGSAALSVAARGLFIFAAGALLGEGMLYILWVTPLFLVFAMVGAVVGSIDHAINRPRLAVSTCTHRKRELAGDPPPK